MGSKRVICPINGELIGYAKEVMIFPPGSIATLENRPVLDADYRAVGVCFPHHMIESVFSDEGYHYQDENPLSKIRRLIETDLGHPWRSNEVAEHFSISEATMRRWLAKSGQGFSKILQNTRLEHGLSLLQSTDIAIAEIALDCGFKSPSHFSDSFKKRFGIKPSQIRKLED
ncbi:MAG: AraC family transcriptional regulator [Cyanobacteria bacterium J06642_11]